MSRFSLKLFVFIALYCITGSIYAEEPKTLPGTRLLKEEKPLDEVMVRGIQRYMQRAISNSSSFRDQLWAPEFSLEGKIPDDSQLFEWDHVILEPSEVTDDLLSEEVREKYLKELSEKRKRFQVQVGVVNPRVKYPQLELVRKFDEPEIIANGKGYLIYSVRWQVTDHIHSEGLYIKTVDPPKARVVVVPDANVTPEMLAGLEKGLPESSQLGKRLAENGCEVIVPTIISRSHEFSGQPEIGYTNQPHREYVYRMAFVIGQSLIGMEVEKIQSAVDILESNNSKEKMDIPIAVAGVGEGGLLSLYSAAVDQRIDASFVAGYFTRRENVWKEPIDRNIWGLLTEFGDAEIAGLIAPRSLIIEASSCTEVEGPTPKAVKDRRGGAAPGVIQTNTLGEVRTEFDRATVYYKRLGAEKNLQLYSSREGANPAGSDLAVTAFLQRLIPGHELVKGDAPQWVESASVDSVTREKRLLIEITEFIQGLIRNSGKVRDQFWDKADHSTVEKWTSSLGEYREILWKELMGKLPKPTRSLNTRTRLILDEREFWGYEVAMDVYKDVIASGILLVPKNLKSGEKRPVVVCQHGLEGLAMDTITYEEDRFKYYLAFASELVKRGFIVYSPQNPYRGEDEFRVIQRMANPLKKTLFGFIIRQHEQTLNWISSLSFVDPSRIAFYGLSYGGKTAVHVPPFLDKYCLSICSGDYNDWISKLSSNTLPFGYLFTGEYEIWMWNMGNLANHSDLANMLAPRPFMVERGHRDGVGIDEMVAGEYARVRRFYDELGIGDKTEIEYFNGPHRINAVRTFQFLHKHLDWPEPEKN